MGYAYSKSFTEEGVKRLYQFYILNILSIIIGLIFLAIAVFSIIGLTNATSYSSFLIYSFTAGLVIIAVILLFDIIAIWIVFDGFARLTLIGMVLAIFIFSLLFPILFLALFIIIFLIFLFTLLWGISYLFIGRKEFGKKHQIFVTTGFILSLIYFILFIANLILTGFTASIASPAFMFTNASLITQMAATVIVVSIVLPVLSNVAFLLFIYNLSKKKVLLWIAFALGIAGIFTFSITSIISLILFFFCYRSVYNNLQSEKVKPKLLVPCPFCNNEIPIDSKSCKYCGKILESKEEINFDDDSSDYTKFQF